MLAPSASPFPNPRQSAWLLAGAAALGAHALLACVWLRQAQPPLSLRSKAPMIAEVRLEPAAPLLEALAARAPTPRRRAPTAEPTAQVARKTATSASPSPQMAPGVDWSYVLIQGEQRGSARLAWKPQGGRYEARLERELEGRALPIWKSEGALSELAGVEPERFAHARQTKKGPRDNQATNFRRDEGRVSYSGSAELQDLQEGTQDRISWWLQLGALVAAEPERYAAGQEIVMPVAGLRGPLSEWHFIVRDTERLELPGGIVRAIHIERLPLGPYDARIDVWLDPRRHYLPVRVQSRQGEEIRWELLFDGERGAASDPSSPAP